MSNGLKWRWLGLWLLLLSAAAKSAGDGAAEPTALCSVVHPTPIEGHFCRSSVERFRDADGDHSVSLAVVYSPSKVVSDTPIPEQASFLRLPDGVIAPLGRFGIWHPHKHIFEVFEQLGFKGMVYEDAFLDRLIERVNGRFCVVYRMRAPFTGELSQCTREEGVAGKVGYRPGIVTVRQAEDQVCKTITLESPMPCTHIGMVIALRRAEDQSLYYEFKTRHHIKNLPELTVRTVGGYTVPSLQDARTYRVPLVPAPVLLEKRERVFCDGRTCQPVADATAVNPRP